MTNLLRGRVLGALIRTWCAGAYAVGCAPGGYPLTEVEAPIAPSDWDAVRAVCITPIDNALGLGAEISAALDAWGVSLPVVVIATPEVSAWCLPVVLVDHVPTKDNPWVGLTSAYVERWRPLSVVISAPYWHACPLARSWVVRHEIGHAVGHQEHRTDGLMGERIGCNDIAIKPAPDYYEKRHAERRRRGAGAL